MIFTEEQIQQFRDHGFLIVPTFFTPRETQAIQAEVARLKREGALYNVATDGDGKTASSTLQNLQLCPMSPHSGLFRALPFHARVTEAIHELIGDPVVLHLDQVFLKPGKSGMGTNWHQDNAYFKIADPLKGTAMWTAVHDATIANGTLHLIPDSHLVAYEHSRDPYSNHHIRCYPPEEKAIPVEIPAGGVVFFAYGVAHCTLENQTKNERAGAAFHFLNGDSIPDGYFNADTALRHPYLTGPLADGGVRDYGVSLVETWEEEVDKALQDQANHEMTGKPL